MANTRGWNLKIGQPHGELGRRVGAPLGGAAVAKLTPPDRCPLCDREIRGNWYAYLGHLGLHGMADNHFGGDLIAAQKHIRQNGLAAQDPFPTNQAWPQHKPLPAQKGATP